MSGDAIVGDHGFLIYGSQFALLLELPETPAFGAPLANQLLGRFLPLLTDGCGEALAQIEPVPMSGLIVTIRPN